jgi:hypothetical protein
MLTKQYYGAIHFPALCFAFVCDCKPVSEVNDLLEQYIWVLSYQVRAMSKVRRQKITCYMTYKGMLHLVLESVLSQPALKGEELPHGQQLCCHLQQ